QDFGKLARSDRPFVAGVASNEHWRVVRPQPVFQDHGPDRSRRMRHFEPSRLLLVLTKFTLSLSEGLAVASSPNLLEFVFDGLLLPRQAHALFVVIAVLRAADDFGDDRLDRRLDAARENAMQRIVIPRRDGIKLVVVTTRAGNGQAEKTFGHHVNPI